MTTVSEMTVPAPGVQAVRPDDHRGSWLPTGPMIAKRFMELTRRRGLMIVLAVVTVGIPTIFLVVRLLAHAFDPKAFGPAGGFNVFTGTVAGALYIFGFIVAATLGCTAGSADLQEGVFRHLVVTGRSRLAIYFARIPAGLAIIMSLVAIGYGIVCLVCSFAAPTVLNYDGANVPVGLSRSAFVAWSGDHYGEVLCDYPIRIQGPGPKGGGAVPVQAACGANGTLDLNSLPPGVPHPSTAQLKAQAMSAARQDYSDYNKLFLAPPIGLMVRTGLWVELEAAVGFIVGLGLASLIGQRTISVILMIVLELILTPIFLRAHIPYMINVQRSIVGVAMDHLGPSAIPVAMGGGGGPGQLLFISEARTDAAIVVVAWLVVWTALGAWRMATRDS